MYHQIFYHPAQGRRTLCQGPQRCKKKVFRWIFHLRGTLSRVLDELLENGIKVSLTTVLRWVKKAGEESVDTLKILDYENWEQPLIIE